MKLWSMVLVAAALLASARVEAAPPDEIRKVLDEQVRAWNRKDLDGYMAGYWKSPELTFYGGGTVTKGWQETLERYRARYQGDGKEMGTLDFQELAIELLGPRAALVRGRWHLVMSGGKELRGLFTVVMRKLDGWKIVHDHSSVE
jgi:beta-aspartyl-peptidase (threonine type)